MKQKKKAQTSWGSVAGWYEDLLKQEGTYQKELILPNLLRLLDIKKGDAVLDLACGPGFFAREFFKQGAKVIGADISKELIELARKNSPKEIEYYTTPAHKLPFLGDGSIDKIVIVLAIQNIEEVGEVFKECARVLQKGGGFFVVLNHPAFRIPKGSSWGWDEREKIQYRRIDSYISESKEKIQMHPGDKPEEFTVSFHRPLQFYFKAIQKAGLCAVRLEEWTSHKKSEPGPRKGAEDRARKEIPLFLMIEATRHGE